MSGSGAARSSSSGAAIFSVLATRRHDASLGYTNWGKRSSLGHRGSLVQVGYLGSTLGLDFPLARKFGQVRPLLGGVVIGLLAGCVGAVPRSALIAGDAQRRSGRRCAEAQAGYAVESEEFPPAEGRALAEPQASVGRLHHGMPHWMLHGGALNLPVAGRLRHRRNNRVRETSCIPSRPHGSQVRHRDAAPATSPDRCRAPSHTRGAVLGDGARDSPHGRSTSVRPSS